jgi:hypothetical protein
MIQMERHIQANTCTLNKKKYKLLIKETDYSGGHCERKKS